MAIDLKSIKTGRIERPPRIALHGKDGIGKSTWASEAPDPIFIDTEDGLNDIECASFPKATQLDHVFQAISTLYTDDHPYRTCVIDTLDWLENLIQKKIAKDRGFEGPDAWTEATATKELGYGRGSMVATDTMREVLDGLDALRIERGMVIIITAHTKIRRFDDPQSEPYDRYVMKTSEGLAGLVREWADVVGFATNKFITQKEDVGFNKKVTRGVSMNQRVINLRETPAYDAKNRYDLPEELPLRWTAFTEAYAARRNGNEQTKNQLTNEPTNEPTNQKEKDNGQS